MTSSEAALGETVRLVLESRRYRRIAPDLIRRVAAEEEYGQALAGSRSEDLAIAAARVDQARARVQAALLAEHRHRCGVEHRPNRVVDDHVGHVLAGVAARYAPIQFLGEGRSGRRCRGAEQLQELGVAGFVGGHRPGPYPPPGRRPFS